ncbi:MAG: hypothetical protein WC364_04920 [Eubacteriales bacterium]|jgi:hypothetical protein
MANEYDILQEIKTLLAGGIAQTGNNVKDSTDLAVTAGTAFYTPNYTATATQKSILAIMTNTSGILSLLIDDKAGYLNGGAALLANTWYAFEIPLLSGKTYNLKLSVSATVQVKWEVGC